VALLRRLQEGMVPSMYCTHWFNTIVHKQLRSR
jgi:hypothetical protein